ncbi:U3 small nucleolar RNA-associated protein 17 [Cytospora mali]|uniref:U3 small nucleolar RNA-associated protein 17 n=1 Tax=Cytospora mali TaxID=578113 RepID=A0A194W3Q9_CYTMA|nr:U3 small nucleolar RNA-associated protein 17 [Valsa mali]
MASTPRSQASKAIEKRKREKTDQEDSSHKRKRRPAQGDKQEESPSASSKRKGKVAAADEQDGFEDELTLNLVKREAQANGDASETTALQRWKISEPMGGRMSDIDPIFSADEKFLLVAYDTSLQVYSVADSLLVRRIALPVVGANSGAPYLVASALSQISPNLVWLASSDGRIWRIDWSTGAGTEDFFRTNAGVVHDMTLGAVTVNKKPTDIIFISESAKNNSRIVAYDPSELAHPKSQILQSQPGKASIVRAVNGGALLVAAAGDTLIVGALKQKTLQSVEDLVYDFYSINTSDDVCSLSVRPSSKKLGSKKKASPDASDFVVDIAIGCVRGGIYIYSDLLSQLRAKLRKGIEVPKKQHWHQRAVHSVAWSNDGNYLISGGSESVLVLWQLDTGKLDFLPHLAASIENIVVSPSGSSYAVHMDDNTTMVLSTAEMKPTTYVSGLQSLVFEAKTSKDALVGRVFEGLKEINAPLAAAIDPRDPSHLLICVGTSQQASRTGPLPVTPFLQRFDLESFQSISKQPLARTNTTELYTTPQGHPIVEPRACRLAFSYDGKWLATVDEWEPPERDVTSLTEGSTAAAQEYARERREIYLKFWATKEDGTTMDLSSRINGPHSTRQSEDVFGIAADKVSNKFATVGEDGFVRIWAPALRERDGLVTTAPNGQSLVGWSCIQTIALGESIKSQDELISLDGRATHKTSGALAYSEDGSILFVAYGYYNEVVIYVIDMESGEIRNSLHDMCKGAIRSLQLLNSCLIILSEDLAVYDLVADDLRYGVEMSNKSGPAAQLTHLAVDVKSRTFAVAVPDLKGSNGRLGKGATSDVAIFSLDDSEPQLMQRLPHLVTALLPAVGSSGFVAIDSAAQIWPITEGTDSTNIARPLSELKLDDQPTTNDATEEAEAVILNGDDEEGSDGEQDDEVMDVDDDEDDEHAAVVAPQRLAEIFDAAPAFAMPPIEDVFYRVVGLFSQKPTATST